MPGRVVVEETGQGFGSPVQAWVRGDILDTLALHPHFAAIAQAFQILFTSPDAHDVTPLAMLLTDADQDFYGNVSSQALKWEAELLSALDVPEYGDLLRIIEKLEGQLDLMAQPAKPVHVKLAK